MTSSRSSLKPETEDVSTDLPAIGIFAEPDSGEEVAGAILRAYQVAHDVLVLPLTDGFIEAVTFAEQLGATVLDRPPEMGNGRDPLDTFVEAAKAEGYPGVIYQEDPTDRLDIAASARDLYESDSYLVEAKLEPAVAEAPEVLVAIPAYNEASAIADVVRQARAYADEVLVIDDGSTDATSQYARDAGATVVEHDRNRGYGAALQTAFEEADRCQTSHLVVLDGDGQHDPADIPRLVDTEATTDADIVIGSRFAEGSETQLPLYRRCGLKVVNLLTNVSMGVVRPESRVGDTQSGFRAYSRRAIESLAASETLGDHMGASTDILHHAHRHGFAIREVPTTVDYDVEDPSTRAPVTHGLQLVTNILQTVERERPVLTLGVPGVASTLVGVGFGYWTVLHYVDAGAFPLALAISAVFFVLAGIFSCFTGIILHSLNQHLATNEVID